MKLRPTPGASMNIATYIKRPIYSFLQVVKKVLPITGNGAHQAAPPDRFRRRVAHALALKPRGAVWNDVLAVDRLAVALRVDWIARDVHPWNCDLPEKRQAELFAEQCLEDVDAAIPRLFEELPEVDILEIGVLKPDSKTRIIAGIVHRTELAGQVRSSLGMRLKTIGINYRYTDLKLEPIA
jgi:hypothetical protein